MSNIVTKKGVTYHEIVGCSTTNAVVSNSTQCSLIVFVTVMELSLDSFYEKL